MKEPWKVCHSTSISSQIFKSEAIAYRAHFWSAGTLAGATLAGGTLARGALAWDTLAGGTLAEAKV